jgi:hypothetical protein
LKELIRLGLGGKMQLEVVEKMVGIGDLSSQAGAVQRAKPDRPDYRPQQGDHRLARSRPI